MGERKLGRRPVLDAAVAELLDGMEQRQTEASLPRRVREKRARERMKIQARKDQRATYDLPPALRQQIKNLADELRLPASQLVTLALLRFLDDLEKQRIDLGVYKQPSHSPRYDWNLVLDVEKIKGDKNKARN